MSSVLLDAPSHLLLLPGFHGYPNTNVLRKLYGQSIAYTLQQVQFKCDESKKGAILDIAVSFPYLAKHRDLARGALYPTCQALAAGIYKLVCVDAAKNGINVEDSEGIDVRVLLIMEDSHGSSDSGVSLTVLGPALPLSILARSHRQWEVVFSIDNDRGKELLEKFQSFRSQPLNSHQISAVGDDGTDTTDSAGYSDPPTDRSRHRSVLVGGTWDHIHIGHKLLLTMMAFLLDPLRPDDQRERRLTVGVTGDHMLKQKKYAELLEDWDERQSAAANFLRAVMDFRGSGNSAIKTEKVDEPGKQGPVIVVSLEPNVLLKLEEISDGYGPSITDENISALILSAETRAGGKAVNEKRTEMGWSTVELFEVDVLDAEEDSQSKEVDEAFASKLSSTGIRKLLSEKKPKSNI